MPFRYKEAMVEPPKEKIDYETLKGKIETLENEIEELHFEIEEIEDLRNTCMPSLYDTYEDKYNDLVYELNDKQEKLDELLHKINRERY